MIRTIGAAAAACGVLLAAAPAGAQAPSAGVVEPATKMVFAASATFPGASRALQLAGTGVRSKLLFKVYAFGFYVDAEAARASLSRWVGKTAEELRRDPSFYEAVVSLPGERAAVLRFVRKVDADKMREAMDDAMERGVPPGDPARQAFLALWNEPLRKGDEVALVFGPGGRVALARDGRLRGAVTSPPLAKALLESWLGPRPVSEEIRAGAVKRIPALIAPQR